MRNPSLLPGPAFVSLVFLPQAESKPQTGSLPRPSCPWLEGRGKVKGKEGVVTCAYNIPEVEARGMPGAGGQPGQQDHILSQKTLKHERGNEEEAKVESRTTDLIMA